MWGNGFLVCLVVCLLSCGMTHSRQQDFFDFSRDDSDSVVTADDTVLMIPRFHLASSLYDPDLEDLADDITEEIAGWLEPWGNNVSELCLNHVNLIRKFVTRRTKWALKFIDSAGKAGPGILDGNLAWLGSFDECRSISGHVPNETVIEGKYCLASVGPRKSLDAPSNIFGFTNAGALRLGLCFPDSCDDRDIHQLISNMLRVLNLTLEASSDPKCQPKSYPYDTKAIVMIAILGVFGLLITTGTIYDIICKRMAAKKQKGASKAVLDSPAIIFRPKNDLTNGRFTPLHTQFDAVLVATLPVETKQANTVSKNGPPTDLEGASKIAKEAGIVAGIFLSFSLFANGKKLLATAHSGKSLTCIHGIRFFSMSWVLMAHSYAFVFATIRNLAVLPSLTGNFWFQGISNATVSVDTFFSMSGLLVCYLFVENYRKTKQISILQYYIHRYWRLTAVYMLIMGVYLCLFKYFNIGPQWNPEGLENDSCRTTWWTNILYVNNLVHTDKLCMSWTWYLANDMQFYWISPLILIPLVKRPKIGLTVMAVFFVAHLVSTAVLTAQNHVSPGILGNGNITLDMNYVNVYYIKPWTRIGPYLVGMFFGYLLAHFQEIKPRLRKDVAIGIWLLAAAGAMLVIYGLYGVSNGHPMSNPVATLYNVLRGNVWALAICWVIFACVHGYGIGYVNTLLSWRALIPLSRLTYCCYLIHIPVMLVFYKSRSHTVDFSHLEIVYYFFGTMLLTYGFAFIFTIGCESPLLALEKFIQKKLHPVTRKES